MIANLRNYEPETIEFVVPDSIREKFPPVLFQGSTNVDELIKLVNEHFNATFPESEVTQRLLDEFEISDRKSTRLNSSHIQKSRMPSSA